MTLSINIAPEKSYPHFAKVASNSLLLMCAVIGGVFASRKKRATKMSIHNWYMQSKGENNVIPSDLLQG